MVGAAERGTGGNSLQLQLPSGENPPWLQGINEELLGLVAQRGQRPFSAAWATAVLWARGRGDPRFLNLLERFNHQNPHASPSEMLRRMLTAEQAQLLTARGDPKWEGAPYPSDKYANWGAWQQGYRWVNNTAPYDSRFFNDVVRRDLTTAVPQRAIAISFLTQVLAHRLPERPFWINCGCSDMSGERLVGLSGSHKGFGFAGVDVLARQEDGTEAASKTKSDIFSEIAAKPTTIGRVLGLDKIDPTTEANRKWTEACATPEEVYRGEAYELQHKLARAALPPSWLNFRLADFSKKKDVSKVVNAEGGTADVVSQIVSWYQGPPEARRQKFDNAFNLLLSPSGLGIVADFARLDTKRKYLIPDRRWTNLNVFVGRPGELFHVMAFTNGRCGAVRVLQGLGELARGGPYESEVTALIG